MYCIAYTVLQNNVKGYNNLHTHAKKNHIKYISARYKVSLFKDSAIIDTHMTTENPDNAVSHADTNRENIIDRIKYIIEV